MSHDMIQQDQHARREALNPAGSYIVQAPAGSGKTELIIQRFLTLLSHVNRPEEILAITFTKKAAHEMRVRVLKALEQAATLPEPEKPHEQLTWHLAKSVLRRDREFNWNLVNNPNQLQIKTIDSFCTYLTGQLPLLSHFGSQPGIAAYAQTLYRETVQEVLSHVEDNQPWTPAIATLLTHTDNDLNRLTRLLIRMLEKRDQWLPYLLEVINKQDKRKLLAQEIQRVVHFHLFNVCERFPVKHSDELLSLLRFSNRLDTTVLPDTDLCAWQAIADMLLTKKNTWRKIVNEEIGFIALGGLKGEELTINRAMRARHKALVECLQEDESLRAALETVRELPAPHYSDSQWETLEALLEVLKVVLAQLRLTFQTYGEIDFIENAWGASLALGDHEHPTDLALSLDYQIKHILVDEFQDTSSPQHRLLEMLTHGWQPQDGRTLFVVGDPMQSIYRFRQAEVGLFIRMQKEGIGSVKLIPLTLAVNFRSQQPIVEWNNQQFSAIFPPYSDMGTGAVHFSHSIAHHKDESGNDNASITMAGFHDANDKAQADAVISYIQQTLTNHPNEKIAILVRSRPHLAAIVPALKAARLRYQAVEIDPLITRQSIQDLLALTRALLHPADRIAWFALLRAPWCGLTLSDLLIMSGQDRYSILWERMNKSSVISTLSPSGQSRLKRILPALQAAMHQRERGGFRQRIEQAWLALGGPATLTDYEEMNDVNTYFTLLEELASGTHHINFELLNERIKQLRATAQANDAPIHIMTIHSAKGLEFDTVILPHLERYNTQDDRQLLLWMEHTLHDEQAALLLAPLHAADSDADTLYRFIEKMQQAKSRFEVDRLLYVAATRAKKRLHLVFNIKDKESMSQRGSFLDKLWPQIKNQVELITPDNIESTQNIKQTDKPISRFQEDWQNPAINHQPVENNSQQTHSGFMLRDHRARIIGTITHGIFQQIALHNIDWWQTQALSQRTLYIQRALMRAGLTTGEHEATIHAMIDRALTDKRGQWILQQHTQAESEFQLSVNIDNQCERLVIDRTFIDENDIRWIIDYKTAASEDEDLSVFLTKQKEQYQKQMDKYLYAMRQLESRPIKMGLYFPAMAAWCEWENVTQTNQQ